MKKQSLTHINWRSALSAVAIVLGTFGMVESPAEAYPHQIEDNLKNINLKDNNPEDSFQLAQVRGRVRIKAPTPLNLRPRTHIPLPSRRHNQRSDYDEHRYRGSRRGHRQYRGYGDHSRDHHDHHTHHRRNRSRREPVIIINPANSSRHRNYNNYDGFIRVIGK